MLVRYSSIPCFDLFHMTEEHTHILKYCEWAGEEVACQVKTKEIHRSRPQELFQAVPTDVGICCAFNFNSTMKETVYARW